MPGPFKTGAEAFRAFEKECQKPVSTTWQTRKKALKMVAKIGVGAGVAAGVTAAVIAVVPAAAVAVVGGSLVAAGVAVAGFGSKKVAGEVIDHVDRVGRSYAHPYLPQDFPWEKLDRNLFKSIVKPDRTLLQLACDRAGTSGSVAIKDLLEKFVTHYEKAFSISYGEPDTKTTFHIGSCREAEEYYRKLVEVDYHLSKAKAYAEALHAVAGAYVAFANREAASHKRLWDNMTAGIQKVMDKDTGWHAQRCIEDEYCYRTEAKVVKAPPPPSAAPNPIGQQGRPGAQGPRQPSPPMPPFPPLRRK